nr:retrovirus-related Pol polyprotein from transposon TNT 1-94 [Tanacetum cinerariifolium]
MATVSTIPQLVDKKGGSYAAIAPKLELGIFNKWKKHMLCYLVGMEPYYIQCIKDGLFKPKTAEGAIKPKAQWTLDEQRVVVQDQRLKSINVSFLPDVIIESVISCETAKDTYTNLVHSFEGTGMLIILRLFDLADIYRRFFYEDNLIQKGKNHARNGEWIDITMRKVNILLSMDEDAYWKNYLKILYCMICKREDHRTSDHEMYTALLKRSGKYKAQPYQYASAYKQILKAKDDPSRQYQSNSNISYYIIPHGRSFTELAQVKHVPEGISLNEHDIPHIKDAEGPPDLINTEGTH